MERNLNTNKSNNNIINNSINNNNCPIISNISNNNNTKNANKSHVNKEKVNEMTTKVNQNKTSLTSNHKSRTGSHSQQRIQTQHSSQQQLTRNNNNNNNANISRIDIGFDRTPVGSATCSPEFVENYETPPYVRWSQDFRYLIDDREGVELFKRYLKSESLEDLLDFWFACEGLKKTEDKDTAKKIIKVIFKKYIMKSKEIKLTDKLKTSLINTKFSADSDEKFDNSIFDEAQNEVEEQMKNSIYINFLRSEIYLSYYNQNQLIHNQSLGAFGGYDSPKDMTQSTSNSVSIESTLDSYNNRNQYYDVLPTVHEDSELQTSYQSLNTNTSNRNNNIRSQSQQKSQSFPINETSPMISSKSSNIVINHINQSLSPKCSANSSSRLSTESHPLSSNANTLYPAHQSYFRSKAMANPPNPYHVKYATILPTSAQDSELQSMSSHSTNESMSCVGGNESVESGGNSGLYSLPITKKHFQHLNLAIKHNAKINSANNTNSCPGSDFRSLIPHPRPIRPLPPSANEASNPDKFASILIEKLDKIKRQQELELTNCKKLAEALQEIDGTINNNINNRPINTNSNSRHSSSLATNSSDNNNCRPKPTLKDALLKDKFEFCASDDSDQSIIDKHFAQVFNETPNETPTDPQLSIGGSVSPPKPNHRLYYDNSKTANSSGIISGTNGSNNSSNNCMIDSSLIRVTVKFSTEEFPYRLSLPGPHITFRKFKQHIPAKRGQWQYYFKRINELKDISSPFVYEMITDENVILPQIEGKIFALIEAN